MRQAWAQEAWAQGRAIGVQHGVGNLSHGALLAAVVSVAGGHHRGAHKHHPAVGRGTASSSDLLEGQY